MPGQKIVEIFTDGACSGNPGPGGWGAILRYGDHEREMNGGEICTTNNRMELRAAIEALKALRQPASVEIYTDSVYLRDGITKWIENWRVNGWKTANKKAVKNVDLWKKLRELVKSNQVEWNWIKGHSNDPMNDLADRLAKKSTPI